MTNPYYNATGAPGSRAPLASAVVRSEFVSIAAAFDAMTGADGTALFLPRDGSLAMTGTLVTPVAEALRMNSSGGFVASFDDAGATRTGYLQFNAGGVVSLAAENASGVAILTGSVQRALFDNSGWLQLGSAASQANVVVRNDTASGPTLVLTNKRQDAANHRIGGVLFDAYSSASDLSYLAGIWCTSATPGSNNGVLNFGVAANGLDSLPPVVLRIEATGNVGIARAPAANVRLDILGANNTVAFGGNGDVRVSSGNAVVSTSYGWNQIACTSDLLIGTAGVERLRIDAAGNVGIGAATGAAKLRLYGNYIEIEDGTYHGYLGKGSEMVTGATAADFALSAGVGNLLFATTAGTERMRITTAGNVGIARAPGATVRLDILGINNTTAFGGNSDLRVMSNNAGVGTVYGWNQIACTSDLMIGTAGVERMRIDTAGNVAVGGATTTAILNVRGNFIEVGDGVYRGFVGKGSTLCTTAAAADLTLRTEAGSIFFATAAGVERMRIDTGGNVGIGGAPGGGILRLVGTFAEWADGAYRGFLGKGTSLGGGGAAGDFSLRCDTGDLLFLTAAAIRMRADAAGNVAIGSAAVTAFGGGIRTLHMQGPSAAVGAGLRLTTSDSSQGFSAYVSGGFGFVGTSTAHPVLLAANNTEVLRLKVGGDVGIETPIVGASRTLAIANSDNTNAASGARLTLSTGGAAGASASGDPYILFDVSTVLDWAVGVDNSDNDKFKFSASPTLGTLDRLSLSTNGDVDIRGGTGCLLMGGTITRFESAEIACPTGTSVLNITAVHGRVKAPDLVQILLRCKVTEFGYVVGTEASFYIDFGGAIVPVVPYGGPTNIGTIYQNSAAVPRVCDPTTGAYSAVTPANWRVVLKCHWL